MQLALDRAARASGVADGVGTLWLDRAELTGNGFVVHIPLGSSRAARATRLGP